MNEFELFFILLASAGLVSAHLERRRALQREKERRERSTK